MRLHEQPTPLDSLQQLRLVAAETPISANSRLHTRLLRDDFSGPSASFRPTAFSASQPGHPDRLFPTWSELNRSVRRLCAIKPGHEVSSGTYSTFPEYAKEKTKKKMPNSGNNNFSTTSGHLQIIQRVRTHRCTQHALQPNFRRTATHGGQWLNAQQSAETYDSGFHGIQPRERYA
jgi:hypothetical protein